MKGGDRVYGGTENLEGCRCEGVLGESGEGAGECEMGEHGGQVSVRYRLVARDLKVKGEKDREDLFAATLPLEGKRVLFSRVATVGRGVRKLLFVDAKKAHLSDECW